MLINGSLADNYGYAAVAMEISHQQPDGSCINNASYSPQTLSVSETIVNFACRLFSFSIRAMESMAIPMPVTITSHAANPSRISKDNLSMIIALWMEDLVDEAPAHHNKVGAVLVSANDVIMAADCSLHGAHAVARLLRNITIKPRGVRYLYLGSLALAARSFWLNPK